MNTYEINNMRDIYEILGIAYDRGYSLFEAAALAKSYGITVTENTVATYYSTFDDDQYGDDDYNQQSAN